MEKLEDSDDEFNNLDTNKEIIEKTKDMKELNKVNTFDPVREDLSAVQTDYTSMLKRKRVVDDPEDTKNTKENAVSKKDI